ncbi:DNA polymerase III subunit delta [Xanthovirga aplysinae]|uniref:DNA polymerase III subunit delta n=1 Tax=Xanthovirga aplysinae TaxID=2529853 RepID=UPI0012BC003C|nr:DNA polymerase III subunit delta [Xanthovirga aplysinae]MTI31318.1 DNA polymerase III subunit delta [Xanthovirga aplysinae]
MAQSAEVVLNALQENQYAPVYFLQGEETYYIDLISSFIENNALPEADKGFNQMVIYGKDVEMNAVITNARRFPMMAERQVVIVKEAQEIQDLNRESGYKILEDYVKNPLPSTILVFCHKHKTLDGRKSLAKTIDKFAILVNTKKLYDNQIPSWIANFLKEKGHKITEKANQMLADNIGNDLERLANEMGKMLINVQPKVMIDEHIVQKFVGISKEYNIFELQRAIGVGDVYKANQIIHYFKANPKDNPLIPIIAVLFSYFNKILLIHHSRDKSEKAVAKAIGVSPYFARDYLGAARKYPLSKVISNIHYLQQADLKSKGVNSGGMKEGEILKELVFYLMH